MTPLRQRMLEDFLIRNPTFAPDSPGLHPLYCRFRGTLLNKSPDKLGSEEIRSYQLFLLNQKTGKVLCLHSGHLRTSVPLPEHTAPPNRHRPDSAPTV